MVFLYFNVEVQQKNIKQHKELRAVSFKYDTGELRGDTITLSVKGE